MDLLTATLADALSASPLRVPLVLLCLTLSAALSPSL